MHKRVYTQTFGAVGAIIEREGKILLVQEARGKDKGKWNQPAGWIDVGEHPQEATVREIKEETGLTFIPEGILGLYSIVKENLRSQVDAGVPHGIKIMYRGRSAGEVQTDTQEVAAAKWFTPQEIDAMGPDVLRDMDIKQEVADYFAGKIFPLDMVQHTVQ